MNQNKKFGAFTSSVDPEKFSTAWESFLKILGIVGGVAAAIPAIGQIVAPGDVQVIIQAFTIVGSSIAAIYQSGNLVYGIVRKIAVKRV